MSNIIGCVLIIKDDFENTLILQKKVRLKNVMLKSMVSVKRVSMINLADAI